MKLKISEKKDGSFVGREGTPIPYFWYKATRESDGAEIRFGSKEGTHEAGQDLELNIEKVEFANGSVGYKEVV